MRSTPPSAAVRLDIVVPGPGLRRVPSAAGQWPGGRCQRAGRGNVNTSEAPYDRRPGGQPRPDAREIHDLAAFLRTLTDRDFEYLLPPPVVSN